MMTTDYTLTEDGAMIDPETGEIVAYVESPAQDPREEVVDWVLERRARAEARRIGLEAERDALIDGIRARFESQIREQSRRVEWLDRQYGHVLQEYAARALEGGKSKSLKRAFGTIGFRASRPKLVIDDHAAAGIALAQDGHPEAVEVKLPLGEADPDLRSRLMAAIVYGTASARVLSSLVPDGVEVEGLHRESHDHPLGAFYVSH